ncbi:MAG: hypothetical protein KatS3mg004_0760 [Bryobacteraceae bacterium]|nr:MAG: hypothetical protein KatS3mg004_0760 [Bryobacteraceae bacterium]
MQRIWVPVWVLAALFLPAPAQAGEDLLKVFRKAEPSSSLEDPRVGDLPLVGKLYFLLRGWPQMQNVSPQDLTKFLLEKHLAYYRKAGQEPFVAAIWNSGNPCCKEWFSQGIRFRVYALPSAAVAVSLVEAEKLLRVWVYVRSAESDGPEMLVAPENVRLLQIAPKLGWMERLPAESVARSITRSAQWRAALVAMSGALATKRATLSSSGQVSGYYSGSVGSGAFSGSYAGYSTVTIPDEEARARAIQVAQNIQANASRLANEMLNDALKKTTVFPGKEVSGFVYFRRDKKMNSAIVQLRLGTVSFEFPY